MRCSSARWIITGIMAGLGLTMMGCGGSDEAPPPETVAVPDAAPPPGEVPLPGEAPPAEAPPPPAEAPAEAPAPPADDAAAPAATEPASADATSEPSDMPAPRAGPSRVKTADAAVTDELLALAQAAPVASPPGTPADTATDGAAGAPGEAGAPSELPGDSLPGDSESYARAEADFSAPSESEMPGDPYSGEMPAGAAEGPGMAGIGGGGDAKADFSDPFKGANTFLKALEAKDAQLLSESIALRAPTEAQPKLRSMFESLLGGPQNIPPETLDQLADAFKDMKIIGQNVTRSTNRRGVIVGKTGEEGHRVTRTIEMRLEKAGWKVSDLSGPRVFRTPRYGTQQPRGGQGYGQDSGTAGP